MTTLTDTQVITASGGLVELGYSQITSNVAVTSTSTGTGATSVIPAMTVVCDGSPVFISCFLPQVVTGATAGSAVYITLLKDGAEFVRYWGAAGGVALYEGAMNLSYRDTPTAGSHTYEVRAFRVTSNGVIYANNATSAQAPVHLRVSKIVTATQWPAVTTGTIICTSSTRPSAPFEGQTIYETDTDLSYTYNGSAWVAPLGYSKVSVVRRVMTGIRDFTSTSYTSTPFSTDESALTLSFSKKFAETNLLISLHATGELYNGSNQKCYYGINVAGTDYDVAERYSLTGVSRNNYDGVRLVTGVSAGTVTIKPVIKLSSSSGSPAPFLRLWSGDDHIFYSVAETA